MHNRGFSLMELLVVITIIGLVAAIAIPSLLRSRMQMERNQQSSVPPESPEEARPLHELYTTHAEPLFNNEPIDGIHGSKWGTNSADISGLNDGNARGIPPVYIPQYPRELVKYKTEQVGDFTVVGEYTFYQSCLYRFSIRLPEVRSEPVDEITKVLIEKYTAALIRKYGEPTEKATEGNTWIWNGAVVEITYHPKIGTIQYLFKPIISYIREGQGLNKPEASAPKEIKLTTTATVVAPLPENACPFLRFYSPHAEALFNNEPIDGIRGFKWGENLATMSGLNDGNAKGLPPVYVPQYPEERIKYKSEEVGDFQVIGEYTFYKEYLYRFSIRLPEVRPEPIKKFTEALLSKYGEPTEKAKHKNSWIWRGAVVDITYLSDNGTVQYIFKLAIPYIQEHQALKKKKKFQEVLDDL